MIQLSHFSVRYNCSEKNAKFVLQNVNLSFQRGEFVCILGGSGSGKSTFLKAFAGLIPSQGQIQKPTTISMVFQDPTLLPWLNIYENILLPFRISSERKSYNNRIDHTQEVRSLMIKSGLDPEVLNYFPHQLSEGMKMRVATIRALITNPQVLLMDEAFGSVDEWNRDSLQEYILEVWKEHRSTVFFVTHSLSESLLLAQRILVIKNQEFVEYQPKYDIDFFKKNLEQRRRSLVFQKELEGLRDFAFNLEPE